MQGREDCGKCWVSREDREADLQSQAARRMCQSSQNMADMGWKSLAVMCSPSVAARLIAVQAGCWLDLAAT